jgi:glycosyltransferase involved in cell wall biosynthesis
MMDRRLCRAADVICPNSTRIADYFVSDAGADRNKITVVPNATRAANISAVPLLEPTRLPDDVADLPRPIVGVIGNLAGNLDWTLLADAVNRTPEFSWLFVGPTDMDIPQPEHRRARADLTRRSDRIRFIGSRPYGVLHDYARAVDVAVLPYRKVEPTYSGSSTRFYEHLAACRPMIGTRGFEELLHKEPLIKLVDDALELAHHLQHLRANSMRDQLEELRWRASQNETWECRAFRMSELVDALPCSPARHRNPTRALKEAAR